jgi:hypothetical protein
MPAASSARAERGVGRLDVFGIAFVGDREGKHRFIDLSGAKRGLSPFKEELGLGMSEVTPCGGPSDLNQTQLITAMTEKPEREEYACRVDETAQPEVNEDGSPPKGAHVVGTHGTTVGTVMPNDQKRAHPSETQWATPLQTSVTGRFERPTGVA